MKVLIFREQQGGLFPATTVDVPDNTPDPESAGWNAYTRSGPVPEGTYAAVRAGKRFRSEQKTSTVTSSLGSMS